MDNFLKLIRRILLIGMIAGGIMLVAMMLIIVGNIIYRIFGHVIPGSYEICELLIVITASFALGFAALHKSHVDVDIVVSQFSDRTQAILMALTSFLAMGTWLIVAWTGTLVLWDRWLTEESEMLLIPFLPFRIILSIGLILTALVYFIDMIQAIKKVVNT